jgi:hypothetical protein
LLCHIVDLPKVKFDGLGPVANRFYETLQRGRANLPKPVDCHQITDRQKPEPYSETGTCGAIFASALAAEPRPRQHLTLQQFLAPLTAPRCPLLGSNPQDDLALSSSDRRLLPTRQFIKCMYTNEIPCEERGVQILTQQVRVGILVMDLGCYSGPRHFLLFLCLYLRIRLGRLNLVVGSNSVSATTKCYLCLEPLMLSIGARYPATIRFFIFRVCYCTKARKHY